MTTYGVYQHSHWQDSGPDELLYVGSREACERFKHLMDACSFCGPGAGNYSTGRCLYVRRPRYIRSDVPRLPESAAAWDEADCAEFERQVWAAEVWA
jgi:hypothetical protein